MNLDIALLLAQDGITNGAIYALLALALVLAFSVTRVIFIPQGEFVAYGALTLVALQAGRLPGTVILLVIAGAMVACAELITAARKRRWHRVAPMLAWNVVYPLALLGLLKFVPMQGWPMVAQIALDVGDHRAARADGVSPRVSAARRSVGVDAADRLGRSARRDGRTGFAGIWRRRLADSAHFRMARSRSER